MNTTIDAVAIRQKFGQTYKGSKNFMTPDVVRYGKKGIYIYEISKGDWMGDDIFGLTVLTLEGDKTDGANGCHNSMEEVEAAIQNLPTTEIEMCEY